MSTHTIDIFPPYTPCTDLRYTRREVKKMADFTPAEAAKAAVALLEYATRDCETGYPDEHYRNAILELETHLDDNA